MRTAGLRVRATSGETWTVTDFTVQPADSVATVKARVLAADRVPPGRAGQYEVKIGGAVVRDESRTLASLDVPDGAGLIVLPRRRRAVR